MRKHGSQRDCDAPLAAHAARAQRARPRPDHARGDRRDGAAPARPGRPRPAEHAAGRRRARHRRRLALLARRKQGRPARPDLRSRDRRDRDSRPGTRALAGAAQGGRTAGRATILRHRDIVRISIGRIPMGPNALDCSERLFAILGRAASRTNSPSRASTCCSRVVNGFTLDETLDLGVEVEGPSTSRPQRRARLHRGAPRDRFPDLVAARRALRIRGQRPAASRF